MGGHDEPSSLCMASRPPPPGSSWVTGAAVTPFIRASLPRAAATTRTASLGFPQHDFVTFEAFIADLRSIARRLGYPLDDEAVAMLVASIDCPSDCWVRTPMREAAMGRARKTMLRAVIKAVGTGGRYIDGHLMALALSDTPSDPSNVG